MGILYISAYIEIVTGQIQLGSNVGGKYGEMNYEKNPQLKIHVKDISMIYVTKRIGLLVKQTFLWKPNFSWAIHMAISF